MEDSQMKVWKLIGKGLAVMMLLVAGAFSPAQAASLVPGKAAIAKVAPAKIPFVENVHYRRGGIRIYIGRGYPYYRHRRYYRPYRRYYRPYGYYRPYRRYRKWRRYRKFRRFRRRHW